MTIKKIIILLCFFISTILLGTLGYYFIEKLSLFNSFYMTIITISTVGFSEIKKLSVAGRVITICLIMSSLTIGAYTMGSLLKIIIEGELAKSIGRKKLNKLISSLKSHYIICGYGRIGSLIAQELYKNKIKFVVIENDNEAIEKLKNDKFNYIYMDATSEEAMQLAKIDKASGVITAVQSDADNLFICLTARTINSKIFILARASDEKAEKKLKRAGANKVIFPYIIGGKRMAEAVINPTVVDFLDIAYFNKQLDLSMEDAKIKKGSKLIGKNLIESDIRRTMGIIIIAIKRSNQEMIFNPAPQEILQCGDSMVVLGKRTDLDKFSKLL